MLRVQVRCGRRRADGKGGEEALFSCAVEDRNVAVTRRTTGMPHIPRCGKQSKEGEWEKNQISTKRCQREISCRCSVLHTKGVLFPPAAALWDTASASSLLCAFIDLFIYFNSVR